MIVSAYSFQLPKTLMGTIMRGYGDIMVAGYDDPIDAFWHQLSILIISEKTLDKRISDVLWLLENNIDFLIELIPEVNISLTFGYYSEYCEYKIHIMDEQDAIFFRLKS